MIRPAAVRRRSRFGKPRASGDDPASTTGDPDQEDVNPARAGMILVIAWFQAYVQSKPRASGDDPAGEEEGWSPWS